ncbi:ATP-binding cassette domain-containing protein [Actinokineospora soli]|uniref:ATP-binding cassette domain-containing protein n=1 Tax=Actinokineospora soli TaxID=1048753 RepID=A0ABW2TZK9_9PSEU
MRLDSPSGSGKSTLFGVLLGFVAPDRGRVLVDGVPLSDVDMSTWRRLVAWVPQKPVFSAEVVADEVGPVPRGELRALARTVAAEHLLDRRVHTLSAGSASGSPCCARWPAATSACCCSTSRPRTSTPRPRRW